MTISDFKKAKPIIEELDRIEYTLRELEKIIISMHGDIFDDTNRYCFISKHSDGSGWSINLSNISKPTAFLELIENHLQKEKQHLLDKLGRL